MRAFDHHLRAAGVELRNEYGEEQRRERERGQRFRLNLQAWTRGH